MTSIDEGSDQSLGGASDHSAGGEARVLETVVAGELMEQVPILLVEGLARVLGRKRPE